MTDDVNGVVSIRDRVTETAPRQPNRSRRFGPLRQFPHAGHQRGILRSLYQAHLAVTLGEAAPDFLLVLPIRSSSPWTFALGCAPALDGTGKALRLARSADGRAEFHYCL